MLGGEVDAATLVDALGAGPPPPACRWGRRGDASTHAQGTDLGGSLVERVRVRRHCAPLCSKLVAAVSGSICIAVASVSVGVIVLSES